jgi:hypothetical protein
MFAIFLRPLLPKPPDFDLACGVDLKLPHFAQPG